MNKLQWLQDFTSSLCYKLIRGVLMVSVFLLQHSYEIGENKEYDESKTIGIFSSREKAEETIEKYKMLPGFKDYPDCFYIDEYDLDKENWEEGFI